MDRHPKKLQIGKLLALKGYFLALFGLRVQKFPTQNSILILLSGGVP